MTDYSLPRIKREYVLPQAGPFRTFPAGSIERAKAFTWYYRHSFKMITENYVSWLETERDVTEETPWIALGMTEEQYHLEMFGMERIQVKIEPYEN